MIFYTLTTMKQHVFEKHSLRFKRVRTAKKKEIIFEKRSQSLVNNCDTKLDLNSSNCDKKLIDIAKGLSKKAHKVPTKQYKRTASIKRQSS